MELSNLMLSDTILTKNICRSCLLETQNMFMSIQDLIEHETIKIKLIDILVYLNCLENNDEENWPQGMCESCVSMAIVAYSFKLNCLKANATLTQILNMHSSPINLERSDVDAININVVYQDHEYDVPLFSNPAVLEFSDADHKELLPLPPVTEITSTEQPKRKEGEKKFSCSICPKSFTRLCGLKYHMERHADIRKHLCPNCGKGFHTSGGLHQHLKSHRDIGQFKCGFCNKNYKSKQSLKEHFRVAHSNNRHSFACKVCDKHFTAKSTLLSHSKVHSGLKQFACSECPRTYTRASYLRLHKLAHSGQDRPKRFPCDHDNCDRRFSTKHSLFIHVAHTHSVKRPYKCDLCLKSFATTSGLKFHKDTHIFRAASCHLCGKQLANKRVLQRHLRLHEVIVDPSGMVETIVDNTCLE